jgi:hypothetical protein
LITNDGNVFCRPALERKRLELVATIEEITYQIESFDATIAGKQDNVNY